MLEAAGQVVPEDLADDDVEEEEEDEDAENEISEDEQDSEAGTSEMSDIEENLKSKLAKSDAPETVHVPKEYAKLVSIHAFKKELHNELDTNSFCS